MSAQVIERLYDGVAPLLGQLGGSCGVIRGSTAAPRRRRSGLPIAELRQITGFTAERLENAIADLQRFYLMPKPRLIESVDRFEMSPNIRTLVRRALSSTDVYRRVENAAKAVSGELLVRAEQRLKITGYARQAIALARQGNFADAEKTLKAGLEEFPNMPALLGHVRGRGV